MHARRRRWLAPAPAAAHPTCRPPLPAAIEKNNLDGAKIYAQNAIRKKHEQLNYLKLASRLDAVVSRLETPGRARARD